MCCVGGEGERSIRVFVFFFLVVVMDSKVLVYHERQVSLLCGVHAINSLLQGGFFTEIELGSLAQRLDEEEATLMRNMCVSEEDVESMSTRGSLNVSNDGDFSLQVLARALNSWGLKCDRVKMEDIMALLQDTETEKAFICHLRNHWFCIRRVDGQWYNLNSLNKHPIRVSDFYLDAYLGSLDEQGELLRTETCSPSPSVNDFADSQLTVFLPRREPKKKTKRLLPLRRDWSVSIQRTDARDSHLVRQMVDSRRNRRSGASLEASDEQHCSPPGYTRRRGRTTPGSHPGKHRRECTNGQRGRRQRPRSSHRPKYEERSKQLIHSQQKEILVSSSSPPLSNLQLLPPSFPSHRPKNLDRTLKNPQPFHKTRQTLATGALLSLFPSSSVSLNVKPFSAVVANSLLPVSSL